jgi:predicted permease
MGNLGGCYAVVGMLLVGFVIGDYSIREVIGDKLSYIMAVFRLMVIPGAFLLVLRLLNVPDMLCIVTCLAYGCPCGMGPVVYPAAYGQDTKPGANLVLITSALAVFTLPLLCSVI